MTNRDPRDPNSRPPQRPSQPPRYPQGSQPPRYPQGSPQQPRPQQPRPQQSGSQQPSGQPYPPRQDAGYPPQQRPQQPPQQRPPQQRSPQQQPPQQRPYQPGGQQPSGQQPPYPPQPMRQRQQEPVQRDYKEREVRRFDALPTPDIAYRTDTQTEVGTESGSNLANFKKRAGAFAIDFGIGLGASYVAQGLASMFGAGPEAVALMGYGTFFGTWLANRAYGQSTTGQSIGKWALNIKTVDTQTDEPPSLIRSVAREGVSSLLIATEALGVPLVADSLFAVFDKEKRQSLHDRAARTQVVNCAEGYQLDAKISEFLEEGEGGELVEDIRGALGDLVSQAQEDESFRDVSKNARNVSKQAGKQMRNWVENVQDKLDNL
ncbi:MAG: RDD family protein [Cyanobacteria bacterium P01_A01_bin.3]